MLPELEKHAAREYLDGFQIIGLQRRPPATTSQRSAHGWSREPAGIPRRSAVFFPRRHSLRCLLHAAFPTTTWLRSRESLEYTPEPDIFHDVFGHVPMHAHKVFADFLEHYGRVCASIEDEAVLEKLGRLFWYTVEFGLIREKNEIKVYGSGLISSHGECMNVIEGHCAIHDFSLDEVLEHSGKGG